MADFFQPGVITTIHRLNSGGRARMEVELAGFSAVTPLGLVLPALYREFQSPVMDKIIEELRDVPYVRRIAVAIGGATREQYLEAAGRFRGFRAQVTPIWLESPAMEELLALMVERDVDPRGPGKGRACWVSFGYLLACGDIDAIALHDCDIRNYDRELLARLVYPLMHPNLGFEFCKGYYARVAERLYGRVTRLFFTPLIRAIQGITPEIPYLRFLDSFRYALAGEFAMKADLARINRIPSDWGLEVGVLAEVYRNCAISRVCQADLADNYEHKHNPLSADDPTTGLRRMTHEIALSLFRAVAQEGFVLGAEHFRTLQVYYTRFAEDTIRRYYADAIANGLQFDRHTEGQAVTAFVESIRQASRSFMRNPLGASQIPNWNRVASAIPDVFERLKAAAEESVPERARPGSSHAGPAAVSQ